MATMSEAQYKAAVYKERKKAITIDIRKIEEALQSDDEKAIRSVHMQIDGKYGSSVPDWGMSSYGYCQSFGFNYESLGKEALIHNLELMKARLEGFALGLEKPNQHASSNNNVSVSVVNTNEVITTICFDEARQKIEDMTALSSEQIEEILAKIRELEEISKENSPRKTKWEKVKPIIKFALEKGVDVGITILSLIMQMKLGM